MKTQLKNRTLWFDGTSEVSPESVPDLLLHGVKPKDIVVTAVNEDVELFNSLSDEMIEFGKTENRPFSFDYRIPEKYAKMDWNNKILEDLWVWINKKGLTKEQYQPYVDRMMSEFEEIRSRKMEMLIRNLIYVEETFRKTGTVWGVGRGSSCASLTLFILGLHKVDPIRYNIPMQEFFHD